MKLFLPSLLLAATLNLSLFAPRAVAQANPIALAFAAAQLLTDLAAIPAGSTVTDAQHQTLVTDLNALAADVFTPSADDLEAFADDLGQAASNGLLNADALAMLAEDFASLPDVDGADDWFADIQSDLDNLLYASTGTPIETLDPLDPTIYQSTSTGGHRGVIVSGASASRTILLDTQGVQPPLLQHYFGRVQLVDHAIGGGIHAASLSITTQGLPLSGQSQSDLYTVGITRKSDGASVVVGKLRVKPYFNLTGDILPPVSADAANAISNPAMSKAIRPRPQAELATYGKAVFDRSYGKHPLPVGFDATDVATITLTDSQGIVRLSGSFDDGSSNLRRQTGHLALYLIGNTPPTGARPPSANVFARRKVTPQTTSASFHLSARHLPANTAVTLLADGESLGQFTTNAKGRLVIVDGDTSLAHRLAKKGLPVQSLSVAGDLSAARSFALTDAQGAVLASGSLSTELQVDSSNLSL